ncbi:hypothetical protein [Caballeronia sp. LZ032]|uniref:hypothetical protein n=1 Tax=Caballeronia sp. LZ032 TaxID=3038565 RepID=UPI0028644152|nr:hypothetical protein [Caballeronia sp. LZ032]MDR5881717.1 hypothetical protein [Caballeronia sp. LZ032]
MKAVHVTSRCAWRGFLHHRFVELRQLAGELQQLDEVRLTAGIRDVGSLGPFLQDVRLRYLDPIRHIASMCSGTSAPRWSECTIRNSSRGSSSSM